MTPDFDALARKLATELFSDTSGDAEAADRRIAAFGRLCWNLRGEADWNAVAEGWPRHALLGREREEKKQLVKPVRQVLEEHGIRVKDSTELIDEITRKRLAPDEEES